jgi:REP element-mobilizing transposase RayT
MLRGNAGCDVFDDEQDRTRFFLLLQECIERFRCQVYAYCLMDNHIHLAVQVGEIPLSRVMQNLSLRYTRWMNWRNQRTGHLFQGRYKAILVDEDSYLLQLVAYLHLNPVRAGMTSEPQAYRWSSHRAYLGLECIPWLSSDAVLSRLSRKMSAARKLFTDFVQGEGGKGHRGDFHGVGSKDSRIFGEDEFLDAILRQTEQTPLLRPGLMATAKCVSDHFGLEIDELRTQSQNRQLSRIRALTSWAVVEFSSSTLTELSDLLSRDVSTLSSALRRLRVQALGQQELGREMTELEAKLATLQA